MTECKGHPATASNFHKIISPSIYVIQGSPISVLEGHCPCRV